MPQELLRRRFPLLTLLAGTAILLHCRTAAVAAATGLPHQITLAPRPSTGYTVLHRFAGGADGASPEAGLIALNGTLYGTTTYGGAHKYGTVFEVTPAGKERVLYAFRGKLDGANPEAGLVNVSGALYGTTYNGGGTECSNAGCGTVFEVTTSGEERIVYRFKGKPDGAKPVAELTDVNGSLYGTTTAGGTYGSGTVFEVTTSGKELVLHDFGLGSDGSQPQAGLLALNGMLYGTTAAGGADAPNGTVFEITTSGKERVLHSFAEAPDGADPRAGLVLLHNALYGTTYAGASIFDAGCVFEIDAAGVERIVHWFPFFPVGYGWGPQAGLLAIDGTLYGTTTMGGTDGKAGTIFAMSTSGSERVLHGFAGGSDGATPQANLTYLDGVIYGTTTRGGPNDDGTVFGILP